ncbi:MAG TPA: energy transducer TonB, partial [Candidatus Eisenbacteria bacterium]
SETALAADLEPAPAAPAPPAPARAAAALPETLRVALQPAGPLPAPVVLDSCRATRPPLAQENGVFGRVMIDALVDLEGRVVATRVTHGVPMLDSAAVDCARHYRFAPYLVGGRPSPFWVAIPVRFTL